MRSNLPVTQNEIVMRDDQMIVSKTDLKGQITYINRDFLDISGFTEGELIGQPHNIVRHPDMPEAAYADLWKTLKAGRPWIGLVKNRCKNGDYYWVEAHATPLYENSQHVGYMSVRKKPTRQQIDATEAVYRQFRENRAGGMRIELGRIVSGAGIGGKFADMTIKAKLTWVMLLMSVMLVVIGVMGLIGMSKSNDGLRDVYELHMVGLADVTGINRLILRQRILTEGALIDSSPENVAKKFEEMKTNIGIITKAAEEYKARITDSEQKQIFERFATDRGNFVKEGLLAVMEQLKAGKLDDARKIFFEKTEPLNTKVVEHVNNLRKYHVDGAKREFAGPPRVTNPAALRRSR
jgi:methyl-accepting chemotaxis protein